MSDEPEPQLSRIGIRIIIEGTAALTTVVLADGKLELPGSVRKQLDLRDGDMLEVEITGQGILLRPTDDLGEEEAVYVRGGLTDIVAGRVREVSETELLALIDHSDAPVDTLWDRYDPARLRLAIRETTGILRGVSAEALLQDLRAERGQDSTERPA